MNEKNFILEFIEVYRSLPALWQTKSKEYNNKYEKDIQYNILLKKYREKYPNAEKKDVAQKINALRTSYRKELKRIERLEKSGNAGVVNGNMASEPNLYYFQAIDFLRDHLQFAYSVQQTTMDDKTEVKNGTELKKRKKPDVAEELMFLAAKRLRQPPDEYDKIVESWAVKFKKMNETQRIYADKFINEILFEGQMGTLNRNSMLLNILNPSANTSPTGFS